MSKKASKNGPKGNSKLAEKQITIADSIGQASSLLGFPVKWLQMAKAAGCPGFRGGRVHLDEIQKWLAKPENSDALKERASAIEKGELDIAREKLRLIRHRANVAEGVVIPLADTKMAFIQLALTLKSKLLTIPANAAPFCTGKSTEEIASEIRTQIISALREIQNHNWNYHEEKR